MAVMSIARDNLRTKRRRAERQQRWDVARTLDTAPCGCRLATVRQRPKPSPFDRLMEAQGWIVEPIPARALVVHLVWCGRRRGCSQDPTPAVLHAMTATLDFRDEHGERVFADVNLSRVSA